LGDPLFEVVRSSETELSAFISEFVQELGKLIVNTLPGQGLGVSKIFDTADPGRKSS
jgi:hypothetical protein